MAGATKGWATREKLDRSDSATRAGLLEAARDEFTQRGYARTTITGITERAEVGRATFYVYFASKEDVFAVLAADVRDRFVSSQDLSGVDADDPRAVAAATTAAYLDAYAENLALITVLEHQAITDPHMYALWEEIHDRPRERSARYVERLVGRGLADPAASPEAVATAAGGMIASFAPRVVNDPRARDRAVADLTEMFLRLLGAG